MASPAPPTIQALKQDFIAEQTRLLSQPLAPSRAWSKANSAAAAAAAGTAPLPQKAVDDALARFNHRLQQHSARVYSPPATRHVAEQLEQLYLAAERDDGAPRAGGDGDDGGDASLTLSADFADAQTIAALPPSWPSDQDASARPMEARRYAGLAARLQDLSAAREEAEARARRLRDMRRGLAPFVSGGESLQRNLVTKDGELERELERTRILMARVGDRVLRAAQEGPGRRRRGGGDDDDAPVAVADDEKRKVADLLDRF
ncbi:hypothetical protein RB595_003138 [Gaeumannomyces hyphopodioides]